MPAIPWRSSRDALMGAETATSPDADLLDQQRRASLDVAAPRLAGYEVIELIGAGAYGDVWKAKETSTGIIVAIKRLRRQPDGVSREDAERLAQLGAARGIVALRKVHLDAEPYAYVMEYLPGGTLADVIRQGPLPPEKAWRIFKRLTDALAYVHKETIIHCDLKPANILLDAQGNPRISDFGQARKAGAMGYSLGTRFYMPPEQVRDIQHDPRWDVYALGAIFYELLTGQKPRYDAQVASRLSTPSSSSSDVRARLEEYARHLEDAAAPVAHRTVKGLDSSVADLIDRCLSLQFDERPKDATAVQTLIEHCDRTRRSRPLLILGGLAPAIMLLILGLSFFAALWFATSELENTWTKNVLNSNAAVAEAIERYITSRFKEQIEAVQQVAQDEKWLPLLRSRAGSDDALNALKATFPKHNKHITRWMLTRANGEMIANYGRLGFDGPREIVGVDDATNGKNFAWRGWFNGREDYSKNLRAAQEEHLRLFHQRPKDTALVAQPYLKVGDRNFLALTISCPIDTTEAGTSSSSGKAFAGIICGSIYFEDFLGEVDEFEESQADQERNVVIVNDRLQVIYHRKVKSEAEESAETFAIRKYPDCVHFKQAFDKIENPDYDYVDPLDGRHYMGSFRLADLDNGQKLAIFVQQEYAAAYAPVDALKTIVFWLATGLLAMGTLFLAVNCYALYWTLRRHEETALYG